jgi:ATP-dependent protease ClpP protease subunit
MNSTMISVNERTGLLKVSGQITEELAMDFGEKLDLLVRYYQHRTVTLQVDSDGGQVRSLQHMLDAMRSYREDGVVFATQAPFKACSAAAVLLATGEPGRRQVSRQTNLLFHNARHRVTEDQTLTADMALRLAGVLSQLDGVFERVIASHLTCAFGGIVELAKEGLARCALLEVRATTLGTEHDVVQLSSLSAETGAMHRMWGKCVERDSSEPYLTYLSTRFAKDTWMALPEAYGLVLIDAIDWVPALLPAAHRPECHRTQARLTA